MQDTELTPIELMGAGQVSLGGGFYTPGEYMQLTNLVMTPEGTLTKRPPIIGLANLSTTRLTKIVGNWGSQVVYAGYNIGTNEPVLYHSYSSLDSNLYSNKLVPFVFTNMPALKTAIDTATGYLGLKQYYIEGVFQYNENTYFLIVAAQKRLPGGGDSTFTAKLFIVKASSSNVAYSHQANITFDTTLTPAVFTTETFWPAAYTKMYPIPPIPRFFVSRDRLWVTHQDTVYFSKATDPQQFAAGTGGGFYKFPGSAIKDMTALVETIYVVFQDSISAISYSTDPNSDARIVEISSGIGGGSSTAYGGVVYVLDYDAIYAVTGNNVQKLTDLKQSFLSTGAAYATGYNDLAAGRRPMLRIEAYRDALYILRGFHKFYSNGPETGIWLIENTNSSGYVANNPQESNFSLKRLDLKDMHLSNIKYMPQQHLGFTDMRTISFGNGIESSDRLYFLGIDPAASNWYASYMDNNGAYNMSAGSYISTGPNMVLGWDSYSRTDGGRCIFMPIEVSAFIKNWVPDDRMHLMKKFRAISMTANLPAHTKDAVINMTNKYEHELELRVYAHGKIDQLVATIPLRETPAGIDTSGASYMSPLQNDINGYRYGINQRGYSLSFWLRTRTDYATRDGSELDFADDNFRALLWNVFELVDFSIFWTYTKSNTNNGRPIGKV